jgi:outer membrane biosynthesis protein TonB
VVAEPEPEPVVVAEPEPEPVVVAEPEPEPVVVAEPEPEPVVVAEPEPEPQPVERPRMPVLPLPPPRPADAPAIPLAPLPDYPVAPHIAFKPQVSVAASSQTSGPAYEAHLLLAPPPQVPTSAIAAGLRPCTNCGLTVSARAHFCRRCGTAQAH